MDNTIRVLLALSVGQEAIVGRLDHWEGTLAVNGQMRWSCDIADILGICQLDQ